MKRPFALLICILLLAASPAKMTERQRALHALNRLGFGPRPGDVERVLQSGVDNWIAQQLNPERIADTAVDQRLKTYATLQMSNGDIVQKYYAPIAEVRREAKGDETMLKELREKIPYDERPQRVVEELVSQRIVRAVDSDRQLNEVMVDFWLNHFNVFLGKGIDRFLLTSYERDVIRPHVWGKFEDLLMATAKSPAMLFYLDNARSMNGKLNENYAREIMDR